MEDYFAAKRLLFAAAEDGARRPVAPRVNVDDPYGRRLAAELREAGDRS